MSDTNPPREPRREDFQVKVCRMPGCDKAIRAKLLCRSHYSRLLRYGSPEADPPKNRRAGHGHIMKNGYIRGMVNGIVKFEHVRMAESAVGHALPRGAEVHHVDGDPGNNTWGNLVVCQDSGYHDLLHQRTNALFACGHADWRKCRFCGYHGMPSNLYISKSVVHHRQCASEYARHKRTET